MEVIRKELNPAQLYSSNLRYNEATDTVEISPDGGVTWQPAPPELDPRHQTEYFARPTDNTRCDAAESMVLHLQKILEQIIQGFAGGATPVVTAILLLFFPHAAIIFTLIALIVGYILALGIEDLNSFNEGSDWNILRCIIFCSLDDDGIMTETGLANVYRMVDEQIFGTNNTIVQYLLDMTGAGILNYAASEGVEDADGNCDLCTDCGWCFNPAPANCVWEFSYRRFLTATTFGGDGAPVGVVTSGGWHLKYYANQPTTAGVSVMFRLDIPAGSEINSIQVGWAGDSGGTQFSPMIVIDNVISMAVVNSAKSGITKTGLTLTGSHVIECIVGSNGNPTNRYMTTQFRGIGVSPFGGQSNC